MDSAVLQPGGVCIFFLIESADLGKNEYDSPDTRSYKKELAETFRLHGCGVVFFPNFSSPATGIGYIVIASLLHRGQG